MFFRPVVLAFLAAVLLSLSPADHAADVAAVSSWPVATVTSTPGETKAAFVLRAAQALQSWATTTRQEACGEIVRLPGGGWSVDLRTEKGSVACVPIQSWPLGAVPTGETIHDHPTPRRADGLVALTRYDRALARSLGDWAQATQAMKWVHMEPDSFSALDYAAGPGYLVASGRLLYQHGQGTAVVVATL